MAILTIHHVTRYRYRNPVALGEHRMMFRPRESHDQRLLSAELTISPHPARQRYIHDVFGNSVGIVGFTGRASELVFDSRVRMEHHPLPAFSDIEGGAKGYAGVMPVAYPDEDLPDLIRSMERQHPDPGGLIGAWAKRFVKSAGRTQIQTLLSDMTQAIYAEFRYSRRLEGGAQTPLETLETGAGACRDFAVFMMEALRSLGFAARFISGYIYSPQRGADRGRIGGGHTHAWVRVYLPACGWVELDPTNGIVGNTDLIRVAVSRDPRQATPLHGTWAGLPSDYLGMDVEVSVTTESDALTQPPTPRVVGLA